MLDSVLKEWVEGVGLSVLGFRVKVWDFIRLSEGLVGAFGFPVDNTASRLGYKFWDLYFTEYISLFVGWFLF